jgi:hypothetical protein
MTRILSKSISPNVVAQTYTDGRNMKKTKLLTVVLILSVCPLWAQDAENPVADKPLFRDPIHDGAADPVVIWNRTEQKWFMLYTNRRANVPNLKGVSWVQGTHIGIAESKDGAHWTYRGVADITYGEDDYSYWAPDVIYNEGIYHMYLTFVPGIHEDWGRKRDIIHLTSADLLKWDFQSRLALTSDRVIDAAVFRVPDGTWRMWYKDEGDHSKTYVSRSDDLYTWSKGAPSKATIRCEGPKVFQWKDRYWLITDEWKGIAVFSSTDCESWVRQSDNLLATPGTGLDDLTKGLHADVVVSDDRAYIFYFTHPGRVSGMDKVDAYPTRRSSIQVAELQYKDGQLTCERNAPCAINLQPPGRD